LAVQPINPKLMDKQSNRQPA